MSAASLDVEFSVVEAAEAAAEVVDEAVGRIVAETWQRQLVMGSTMMNTEGPLEEPRGVVQGALRD